jgi:hypothetical protein
MRTKMASPRQLFFIAPMFEVSGFVDEQPKKCNRPQICSLNGRNSLWLGDKNPIPRRPVWALSTCTAVNLRWVRPTSSQADVQAGLSLKTSDNRRV